MNDDELHDFLRATHDETAPHFAHGFADRVMRRMHEAQVVSFDLALARQARRVLPALAAASMALAVWNYVSVRDRAPSTFGAMLGVASSVIRSESPSGMNGLMNAEVFE